MFWNYSKLFLYVILELAYWLVTLSYTICSYLYTIIVDWWSAWIVNISLRYIKYFINICYLFIVRYYLYFIACMYLTIANHQIRTWMCWLDLRKRNSRSRWHYLILSDLVATTHQSYLLPTSEYMEQPHRLDTTWYLLVRKHDLKMFKSLEKLSWNKYDQLVLKEFNKQLKVCKVRW